MPQITNEIDLILAKPDTSLLDTPKKFSQGDFKTLEEIVQFNPQFFIRRRIFATDSVQFDRDVKFCSIRWINSP